MRAPLMRSGGPDGMLADMPPTPVPRNGRIVIADDRPPARAGLRALLAAMLPAVDVVAEAANGQEAIELVERSRPGAVVLDVRMPGMDGLEATRIIKARWPTVRLVIVAMHPEHQASALAAGADAFVSKLDPPEVLISALELVMA
jgi:DNA-binding NarL/FixJ family response regulator